jgi:DNA-directed RNA polymerase subunit omega
MAEHRPTMMDPPIEGLVSRVDSKFTLVTLTARRAREITTYFCQLGQGLGAIVPPQVMSASRKPVSIALDEINHGRIVAVRHPQEPAADAGDGGLETKDV